MHLISIEVRQLGIWQIIFQHLSVPTEKYWVFTEINWVLPNKFAFFSDMTFCHITLYSQTTKPVKYKVLREGCIQWFFICKFSFFEIERYSTFFLFLKINRYFLGSRETSPSKYWSLHIAKALHKFNGLCSLPHYNFVFVSCLLCSSPVLDPNLD